MDRKHFLKNSFLTGSAAASGLAFTNVSSSQRVGEGFNLDYAPHFGMFEEQAGSGLVEQLEYMKDKGFNSLEDNGLGDRSINDQDKIGQALEDLNMQMGVFVAHDIYWKKPNLTSGDPKLLEEFLADIKKSVEVAKRVNARWVTVVPGHEDLQKPKGYQTANVVKALRKASKILEPHEITMVLEPLNFRDHPGLFLKKIPQAYEICRAVDSPSCKILFDIYHQQITEGNLIPNIDRAWDEIAYFQVGDNPGRNEPGTGEINYKNIFKHIYDKGYKGIVGMEHGKSKPGKKGEAAVIDAYRQVDNF